MKLSILDQSPISSGRNASDALKTSIKLAKLGDQLGYERFWIAEHHDLFGLACSNPDVMIGIIGAQTEKIRVGAGAVLLPYYKPFRVAETYNLLATLFPNRIDLGLGRAPGGPAEVSLALSDNYLEQVRQYSEKTDELLKFLHDSYEQSSAFSKISPTPVPKVAPHVWMLGTSEKSAHMAAEKGMPYVFGHFMADEDGVPIVHDYQHHFSKSHFNDQPTVIVTVSVICAETEEKANNLALSYLLWQLNQHNPNDKGKIPSIQEAIDYMYNTDERRQIDKMREKMIIGDPIIVKKRLINLKEKYNADELMIVTITHDEKDKFNSYRLIMEQFM